MKFFSSILFLCFSLFFVAKCYNWAGVGSKVSKQVTLPMEGEDGNNSSDGTGSEGVEDQSNIANEEYFSFNLGAHFTYEHIKGLDLGSFFDNTTIRLDNILLAIFAPPPNA